MPTDDEARARLLKIQDDAKTFVELADGIAASVEKGAVFGCAVKFIAEGDASGLDGALQERFAQVLSRFVESPRALHLAGALENKTAR